MGLVNPFPHQRQLFETEATTVKEVLPLQFAATV
jgi:hypothetical protein